MKVHKSNGIFYGVNNGGTQYNSNQWRRYKIDLLVKKKGLKMKEKRKKKEVVSLNISIDNSNKTIKIIFVDKKNHK